MKRFSPLFLLMSLLLALWGVASAQTAAGVVIQNTAQATYTDAAGATQTATSNTVTTEVQPIYRFAITPDGTDVNGAAGQTEAGAAGGTVVFTYQLENQGNTPNNVINLAAIDSLTDDANFGTKTIYLDNGDGIFGPEDTAVTSVTMPFNGAPVVLFVQAAIPATVTDVQVLRLNLEGRSALGGEEDLNNWAELDAFTNAALTLDKTATGSVVPSGAITYTVSGTNTGGTNPYAVDDVATITSGGVTGARDGLLISDVLPAGLTYVSGSLAFSGSNTGATTVLLYSTNGGTNWVTVQPASGVNAVAAYVVGSAGARVPTTGGAAFSYGFTFQATAPANAASASIYTNTGTVRYDSNGDSDGADTGEVVSDTATTTIDAAGTFAVGPYTFPNAGATGSYTVAGEGYTITRSGDTQTIASVANEREVSFRHSLQNSTNYSDSYALTSTLAGLPAGSVSFYAVNPDGSRGALITAPLAVAAGATAQFYTVVTLAPDYLSASPLTFTVTATSSVTSVADTTSDTISAVTEAQAVNIGNYDGDATPNDTPDTFPATPGTTVSIPLIVSNGGADSDTFDFTSAIVPAGYTVTVYSDANCDGIVNGTDIAVTDTGLVEAGTFDCFIAQVVIPAGASAASYDVTVTATSRADPDITDAITNTVTVGLLQNFTFEADLTSATNATVPVVYQHTLTNNSNDNATVDLSRTGGTTGWTYEYSLDGTTYTATLPQDVVLAAGASQLVYVRVTPDPVATEGTTDTLTLTATPTYTGGIVGTADTVTDTTTIDAEVYGQLNLVKTVSAATAEPGDTLTYTITATNIGAGALTNVKVQDAVPANTTFVSVSAAASGGLAGDTVLYSTDGTTWSQTAPTAVTTGNSIFVGVSANGDNTINGSDIFTADGVLTITLTVTID